MKHVIKNILFGFLLFSATSVAHADGRIMCPADGSLDVDAPTVATFFLSGSEQSIIESVSLWEDDAPSPGPILQVYERFEFSNPIGAEYVFQDGSLRFFADGEIPLGNSYSLTAYTVEFDDGTGKPRVYKGCRYRWLESGVTGTNGGPKK